MKYYEILNFQDEPFSNSPDPDFFYESPKHLDCLNRLEIALRLKRGLNVVLGDVGTGKTTLCRRLLRTLADDETIDAHLLLDPDFDNPRDLLLVLCEMLEGAAPEAGLTEWSLKERVKSSLFKHGVDLGKTIVLIIDEGQKIHDRCMELLRELLNYETNDAKLLQIVIFAQLEFEPTIRRYPNFADRINDLIRLGPLDFRHTRELINYRINLAKVHMSRAPMFTWGGYLAMHRATGGYPRKIVKLAHKIFLALILNNDHRATWSLVRTVSKENYLADKTRLPAGKTEIGASKSLFAQPKSPSVEAEGDEIEGARYPWAAGAAMMVLLVLLVAGRAETPSDAPLVVGSSASIEAPQEPSAQVSEEDLASPDEPIAQNMTAAKDAQPSKASLREERVAYRARIVAPRSEEHAVTADRTGDSADAPELLGSITLAEATPLAMLLERVYGRSDGDLRRKVLAMNESLTKGDGQVPAGVSVVFPVEMHRPAPSESAAGYVVQIGRYASLADAYEAKMDAERTAEAEGQNAPETAILPQWSAEKGLMFSLVYAQAFDDEGDALVALRSGHRNIAQPPEIVASWGNEALLLADVADLKPERGPKTSGSDLFPPPGPVGE